jgi:hypothetical protein
MVTVRISERSIDKLKTAAVWAVLLFLMLALGAVVKAQQTVAPFYASQTNTNLYVKMGQGSPYPTIAAATTKACTAPSSFNVILLPGANPADSIGGQTGVCNGVVLIDYTAAPAVTYKGNGTIYVAQGGGGGCSGPCVVTFNLRAGAVTLTAPDLQAAVAAQTGCAVSGNAWNPATNTCVPAAVTAAAMQSAVSGQTGCAVSGNAWNPATNTCVAAAAVTAAAMQSALTGQTGCTTAGNAWNPATNTCVPAAATIPFVSAAECSGGSAQTLGLFIPSANAPPLGCFSVDNSALGYMAFYPAPSTPQYAIGSYALPASWSSASATLKFAPLASSGTVTYSIQTACTYAGGAGIVTSAPTWGTAVTVTTTVSSLALVTTANFASIAATGTNGCGAGSLMNYRISRGNSDTMAANANLLGVQLVVN